MGIFTRLQVLMSVIMIIFFFPEVTETQLGNNKKKSCEGQLSATECLQSLKTMESDKSPGTDGIPAEFNYKVFWDDVSPFLPADEEGEVDGIILVLYSRV